MHMRRFLTPLLLTVALALSACGEHHSWEARREAAAATWTPTLAANAFAGRTTKNWSRWHGTQIEYLAADGRSYLWYPGNHVIVPGYWKTKKDWAGNTQICGLYGGDTYNPVTGERGGNWECYFAYDYLIEHEELVQGDPLRLKQQVPFVMPKKIDMSISQAMEKAGFGPLKTPNLAIDPRSPQPQ